MIDPRYSCLSCGCFDPQGLDPAEEGAFMDAEFPVRPGAIPLVPP
jgi:hypothetical protein